MDKQAANMGILSDLSELISLRMKSYLALQHGSTWIEHRAHVDYDLWFIQEGTVAITIKGVEHRAYPGDVVFFYPDIPYKATTVDQQGCRFTYIHFDFEIGKQQRILNDFQLSGIVPHELLREEVDLFNKALAQAEQSPSGNRLYLKACLTAVVAKIIERYGQGQYTGAFIGEKEARTSSGSLELLHPVFDHIHHHIHQPIRMNELAALVGISEKYFITSFKKALGITPGQYIYQIRMNRARDYLNERKYSVQQIASLLGYPDPFTFSKAFKKYYQVAPSKFE
ncbi:AraC-like DNA-binding protein [Paenibacillus cellulosilyticus]|uniref:AraC-like DNA-binding protein n=1 Tax=Paenibacillus cellulosilyticus TaxID=375489 RepID=A0A2V2YZM2_9BACL|nr:AraC family transcriptional regulator [Paenibacillus cellulosilyticus]PWV99374.1 AraC-like DNA-binding protein [Paenibacillus cellulosilyticus]QKS45138.1 AraC family transcriptional regulator [Paenibacillus cellulosilyticus]